MHIATHVRSTDNTDYIIWLATMPIFDVKVVQYTARTIELPKEQLKLHTRQAEYRCYCSEGNK